MSARAPAPVGATCNRSAAGLGGAALREETLLELADAVADVERTIHTTVNDFLAAKGWSILVYFFFFWFDY